MEELETPRMLYQAGGSVLLESGAYTTRIVADPEELEAALADGWHLDQYAAKDAAEAESKDGGAGDKAPAAPTRAELEVEATALGIAFDGRWGVKKLAEAIAEKKAAA